MKGLQEIAMSRIELKAENSLICGWSGVGSSGESLCV